MNLSTELQEAINQWAETQGISAEDFIQQAVTEKLNTLQQSTQAIASFPPGQSTRLREKNGILILETDSAPDIDVNAWIEALREERIQEQISL